MRRSWLLIFSRTNLMSPRTSSSVTRSPIIEVSSGVDIFIPHNRRRVVGAERHPELLGHFHGSFDMWGLGRGGLNALLDRSLIPIQLSVPRLVGVPGEGGIGGLQAGGGEVLGPEAFAVALVVLCLA